MERKKRSSKRSKEELDGICKGGWDGECVGACWLFACLHGEEGKDKRSKRMRVLVCGFIGI